MLEMVEAVLRDCITIAVGSTLASVDSKVADQLPGLNTIDPAPMWNRRKMRHLETGIPRLFRRFFSPGWLESCAPLPPPGRNGTDR
jgi:hypothetical protein